MRAHWIFGVVAGAVALAACGGDPCAQKSPCPKDMMFTQDEIDQSAQAIADGVKCAAESKALLQCINGKTQCDANGMTDSTKLGSDCSAQYKAKTDCITATPDGGP
jgi:hypothetical protein